MAENVQIMSPVGRIVQGHPMRMTDKGYENKPLTDKQGIPREECFFAVAFPKTDPLMAGIWQQLQQVAAAGFPGGQSQYPTFSWKVKDGDQPPHNNKEGFPGNYVFGFKSGFQPTVWQKGGTVQIVDPTQVKCGDYVRVHFNVAPNGDLKKPGIYINPNVVELVGYGTAIISGPNGDIFGQQPVAGLPPGASATPTAGPAFVPPGLPAAGPALVPPGLPAAGGMPPGLPAAGHALVPPGLPAAGGMPPGVRPAPAFLSPVAVHQMTAAAGGVAYDAFIAQGWTDELLVTHGMMLP